VVFPTCLGPTISMFLGSSSILRLCFLLMYSLTFSSLFISPRSRHHGLRLDNRSMFIIYLISGYQIYLAFWLDGIKNDMFLDIISLKKVKKIGVSLHQFLYRVGFCQNTKAKVFCSLAKHNVNHCHCREDTLYVLDRTIEQEICPHDLCYKVRTYVHRRP
jgi:hypothetical protein